MSRESSETARPPSMGPGPPYELIRDRIAKRRVIPFLGSGASLLGRPDDAKWHSPESSFLPAAGELADYLDKKSGYPSLSDRELTRVAQFFDGVAGRGGLDLELHEIFANRSQVPALHRMLAHSHFPLIITTNYDSLLEQAFEEENQPYHLVVYQTGSRKLWFREAGRTEVRQSLANAIDLPLGKASVIFKMHGTAQQQPSDRESFVITEDDYIEFLTRMASKAAIPSIFGEPFRNSHFLFLGYGLRDWNLRVILHKIWSDWPQRRFQSWAIQHRAQPLEREFWSKRQLTIYEMNLTDFVAGLRGTSSGPRGAI
jgi:hypothetical protein